MSNQEEQGEPIIFSADPRAALERLVAVRPDGVMELHKTVAIRQLVKASRITATARSGGGSAGSPAVNAEAVNDRVKLLFHRLIARRLGRDPDALALARAELARQAVRYGADAPWIAPWANLLDQGAAEVRAQICKRSERMTWLRTCSPLGDLINVTDPDLRRQIWRRSRIALTRRAAG